jgi:hypothetical protein
MSEANQELLQNSSRLFIMSIRWFNTLVHVYSSTEAHHDLLVQGHLSHQRTKVLSYVQRIALGLLPPFFDKATELIFSLVPVQKG